MVHRRRGEGGVSFWPSGVKSWASGGVGGGGRGYVSHLVVYWFSRLVSRARILAPLPRTPFRVGGAPAGAALDCGPGRRKRALALFVLFFAGALDASGDAPGRYVRDAWGGSLRDALGALERSGREEGRGGESGRGGEGTVSWG